MAINGGIRPYEIKIGIIALGMTFVIISGGIDLSVGSVYVTVGAFIMVLLNTGAGGWLSSIGLGGAPANTYRPKVVFRQRKERA